MFVTSYDVTANQKQAYTWKLKLELKYKCGDRISNTPPSEHGINGHQQSIIGHDNSLREGGMVKN